MTRKSRIVLADDHPIFLAGLRALLQADYDFEVVGEATNGFAALTVIREQKPDVTVIDITMPELNGIQLGQRLAAEMSATKLLVLTLHEDRAYLKQALNVGARGYVLKRSAAENLVQAIRAVIVGGLYVDPTIANQYFNANPRRTGQQNSLADSLALTDRETEVLKLVAKGFTNKEIARKLAIGVKSIETYRARGSEKLGLKTRAELIRYASAEGWLEGV